MTTKHILAVQGLDGTLKVNDRNAPTPQNNFCPHTDVYWLHDDVAGCKICRQCHRILNYVIWETTPAEVGHDGSQS